MKNPRIAILSFPGTNGDTENLATLWRCGFDAFVFCWNESHEKLNDVDGYFTGAGFSYEDRGRSGMVAARDRLLTFIAGEAAKGKPVVGNCNGAQILVESGLIPLDRGLRMSLARNAIKTKEGWESPGFLNEWIWMTPACARNRCAMSDWTGAMHIPIAHGEGRFTTTDPELFDQLKAADQLAFCYCTDQAKVSTDPNVTPNGSTHAVAGICNPAGNVVAIMPHPERTTNGDPYFQSLRRWIVEKKSFTPSTNTKTPDDTWDIPVRSSEGTELLIDTVIVNNEERTVEQAARRVLPELQLKQFRHVSLGKNDPARALTDIGLFNPHKEIAYIRRGGKLFSWNSDTKKEEVLGGDRAKNLLAGLALLRRDVPDTGAGSYGPGSETGILYMCRGIGDEALKKRALLEIFANPHASVLERLSW